MAAPSTSTPQPFGSPSGERSSNSSQHISYELFAPRSSAAVTKLNRIAELTAGRTVQAEPSDVDGDDFLLEAMSPPPVPETAQMASPGNNEQVAQSLENAIRKTEKMTTVLKHSTSVRLALRASINIAEDISNRHTELIRHSSELSAAADRLQEEQEILSRHAEEIGMPLKHYDAVDELGVQVGVLFKGKSVVRGLAKIKVDNDDFTSVLDKIDDAVDFFGRECGGKEVLEAELKKQRSSRNSTEISGNIEYYRRSLALQDAALFLIREAVADRISSTSQQVMNALNLTKVPLAADKLEASLVYTRFHGISSRSNRLLRLVRTRLGRGEAYHDLLQLCRNTYCNSRLSLLKTTIQSHMEKLKDQHGLVGMTRLACVFLVRICTVETSLYLDFFGEKKQAEEPSQTESNKGSKPTIDKDDGAYHDSEFQNYLATLCGALHRTIRRGLVTVLDLDTLCQVVSVLREERSMASASPITTAAARAISSVIEDAQERLIFCATNSLTKEVVRFKATPKDLDYPDKLRKPEKKAGQEEASGEEEIDAVQKQLQVYESWFPPMRSVLRILSKIFRVVEPRVFEDIALQSVQACTRCLRDGASYILKRRGTIHADLFLVKHLLILREQLSPFDVELRSVERQLDFSDAGKAVSRFLANRNRRLFAMSTENALLMLLREGVSIQEESVDSKRDLEDALRSACNAFIDHTTKMLVGDIVPMVEKCQKTTSVGLVEAPFFSGSSVKVELEKTSGEVESEAGKVTSEMSLYLDNPATKNILLKPISRKALKTMDELRKYIAIAEDGKNEWDETLRGQIFLLIDDIDKKIKSSLKVNR